MTTTDIVTTIDQRLTEAKAEITRLESARQALLNGTASSVAPRPRRQRRSTARPAHEIVPAGKLVAQLDGSPGMSTVELATATKGQPQQILSLLRELEKTDQIRRSGERRSTRWHLITDEDRIAARAAELAAQRRSAGRKAGRPPRQKSASARTTQRPGRKATRA